MHADSGCSKHVLAAMRIAFKQMSVLFQPCSVKRACLSCFIGGQRRERIEQCIRKTIEPHQQAMSGIVKIGGYASCTGTSILIVAGTLDTLLASLMSNCGFLGIIFATYLTRRRFSCLAWRASTVPCTISHSQRTAPDYGALGSAFGPVLDALYRSSPADPTYQYSISS